MRPVRGLSVLGEAMSKGDWAFAAAVVLGTMFLLVCIWVLCAPIEGWGP